MPGSAERPGDPAPRLRWARDGQDVDTAMELRRVVFCDEQGVPQEEEVDGRDGEALHLLALAPGEDRALGTLRLLFDGDRVKVGRVAVAREWRRRGLARRMLQSALALAAERGVRHARLASQLEVVPLYEQEGFAVESEVFEEAGIPHVWMARALPARGVRRELVIFDCDGVLVDSERTSNRVLAEMLAHEGLELSVPEARARFQGRVLSDVAAIAGRELGRALPDDWIDSYERRREQAFRAELAPVAGAGELVRGVLTAGLAACVASQGSLAKTALSLSLTGLDELFAPAARFSAGQVAHGKPAPDLFLFAAHSMGCEPRACAVVEDTPSGVTAAVSAGMSVFGYAGDSDAGALRSAGAHVVTEELGELLPLLVEEAARAG